MLKTKLLINLSKRMSSSIQTTPNTLIFDAGDIFQGTPYFNFFKGDLELF